jgi:hypothetical protein
VTTRERIDQDVLHRRAQVGVLSGLAAGDDVVDLMAAAAPSHVSGWFTPDVALLEIAVTALDIGSPSGAQPLEYDGLRERYLPEVTFRGRVEHGNSQYALHAAASMRGGLHPDLLSDAGWWQTRCGSTPSTPSSSTAGRRQSAWPFQSRRLLGGSPPRHSIELIRDQLWSREGHLRALPGRIAPAALPIHDLPGDNKHHDGVPSEPSPEFLQKVCQAGRPATLRGAGDRDRTGMASLEGWGSTIELHPRGAAPE